MSKSIEVNPIEKALENITNDYLLMKVREY